MDRVWPAASLVCLSLLLLLDVAIHAGIALPTGIAALLLLAVAGTLARFMLHREQATEIFGLTESLQSAPGDAVRAAATRIGEHFNAARCSFAEIDETATLSRIGIEYRSGPAPSALGAHRLADFGEAVADALRCGSIVEVADVTTDPRTREVVQAYRAIGTRSLAAFPLVRNGRLRALLAISHAEPRHWTEAELRLAEDAAARSWAALEQSRAEAALERTEADFRTLADNITQLAWMTEPDGYIIWYNRRWYDYTGTTLEQMQGWGWSAVHHPDHLTRVAASWREALASGEPWQDTFPLRGKDGSYRWFLSSAQPVRAPDGRIRRWFGTNTDITEAREREEALRRSELALAERDAEAREAQRLARIGSWRWRRGAAAPEGSPELHAIFGLDPATPPIDFPSQRGVLFPESAWDALDRARRRIIDSGEPWEMDLPAFRQGEPIWVTTRGEGLFDQAGTLIGLRGTVQDITLRKQAEDALRESETRLRIAIDATEIGIFDWNLVTDDLDWDERLRRLWSVPDGMKVTIDTFYAALHPDDVPRLSAILAAAHDPAGGGLYEAEYRVTGLADRRLRHVAAYGRTFFQDGRPVRMIGGALDVTPLREAQAVLDRDRAELERLVAERTLELQQAHAQLAHAQRMEALGQLAGGIAHDFNNVLQAVQGGAALIERRPTDPDAVRRLARMMADATNRGAAVTRRLLAFARRADLRSESVDAATLLESMSEILTHTLGGAITVRLDIAPDLPPLLADKGQLETVLVNLATNARDAMPAGGTLTLAASAGGPPPGMPPAATRLIRIDVRDTGSGMTQDVLTRAAEPFFTTKPQGSGTGLGLAMAKGFAEQSGGAFRVDSQPGLGTVVSLWFPAVADSPRMAASEPAANRAVRSARILLVDDDPLVREVTSEQLESEGYAVIAADGAATALEHLDSGLFIDLLLSDLSMPGMDGLALIREAQRRRPGLPAILLTGFASNAAELALGGALSGTFSLLRKPATAKQIAERAETLIADARSTA